MFFEIIKSFLCLVGNKRADIARVIPCKNNFCTKFAHRFHFCGLQKLNTLNLRLFHPPLNPCNHFPTVLIKTNWYTISYKFDLLLQDTPAVTYDKDKQIECSGSPSSQKRYLPSMFQ